MSDLKPIETEYNGYRFRSRLEARWAVFFDALGVEYEYEPEGFVLDDGTKYLPDFYIPSCQTYVEIKNKSAFSFEQDAERYGDEIKIKNGTESAEKYWNFAKECAQKGKSYMLCLGDPAEHFEKNGKICFFCRATCLHGYYKRNNMQKKCTIPCVKDCSSCWVLKMFDDVIIASNMLLCGGDSSGLYPACDDASIFPLWEEYAYERRAMKRAAYFARGARFEHGEAPKKEQLIDSVKVTSEEGKILGALMNSREYRHIIFCGGVEINDCLFNPIANKIFSAIKFVMDGEIFYGKEFSVDAVFAQLFGESHDEAIEMFGTEDYAYRDVDEFIKAVEEFNGKASEDTQ